MTTLRTAFIYLHAQAGPDFFADTPFAWTAGELRRLGFGADVMHVHFERDRPAKNQRLSDELIETVRAGGYGLCVLEHCWLPEIIARLQNEAGALVCETEPYAVHPDVRVDFVLHHFTDNRQPLIDLVQTLAADRGPTLATLREVRNLRIHLAGSEPQPSHSFAPHPAQPDARRPFCPVIDRITIGTPLDEQGRPPPIRKTLDTNKGCPFAEPVRSNPQFADVDLDEPGVTLAGCAFCFMGGDYKALPRRETVAIHLDQIAWYQRELTQLDEVVLRDQHAIRYVPELLRGAIERGLRPFGVLVPGRGDAILRYGDAMQQAAEIAAGTGFWFTIYLVGFESFSQPQLDLYNKGVTVAQYAEALRQMRALHREFPDAFGLYAAGASSFILWNPWTTLDDLRANVDFCRDNAVWRLARGLTTTRLRLYPNLPLFHKARADGLLDKDTLTPDRGAGFTGYSAEASWRYADAKVAIVEELNERLRRACRASEQVGVLDACERFVRGLSDDATDRLDPDAIENQWLALRGMWRSEPPPAAADGRTRRTLAAATDQRAARTVVAGRTCNNRCLNCVGDHAEHEHRPERLAPAFAAAALTGRITVAGREPTLLPKLPKLLKDAGPAKRIELLSNGRALANPGVARRLAKAGVTDWLLKRHRLHDEDEDAYCRAKGAGNQLWSGIERLVQEAPSVRFAVLIIVTRDGVGELVAIADKAVAMGAVRVQLQVMAGEVDLAAIAALVAAIEELRGRHDVAIDGF